MGRFSVPLRKYLLADTGLTIRFLIISDVVFISAKGLLGPVFALFIENYIVGANAMVVGIAATVFLLSKSLLQVPFAHLMDKIKGERDDFLIMFIGTFFSAIIPLAFLFIHTPFQLYVVEFLLGVGAAMAFPSFMAIFTRHISEERVGVEWGIYFMLTDLGSALAATIGGVLVMTMGFPTLIIGLTVVGIIGALLLLPIKRRLRMP
ncbi:MAG: MFS transporter [Patescibacteria group bacterium]|jgi:MFS family permease